MRRAGRMVGIRSVCSAPVSSGGRVPTARTSATASRGNARILPSEAHQATATLVSQTHIAELERAAFSSGLGATASFAFQSIIRAATLLLSLSSRPARLMTTRRLHAPLGERRAQRFSISRVRHARMTRTAVKVSVTAFAPRRFVASRAQRPRIAQEAPVRVRPASFRPGPITSSSGWRSASSAARLRTKRLS